jgi:hypothetical protein
VIRRILKSCLPVDPGKLNYFSGNFPGFRLESPVPQMQLLFAEGS